MKRHCSLETGILRKGLVWLLGFGMFSSTVLLAKTTANNAEYITAKDAKVEITLAGSSDLGEPVTFELITQPINGTLSGTPPNLVYTPKLNYQGWDEFQYRALDSSKAGEAALIKIQIGNGIAPPKLTESEIGLFITKQRSAQIWKVLVDEEERPYLELIPTLQQMLDLVAECDLEKKTCEATLHQLNRHFYLDGQGLEFGSDDTPDQILPDHALVEWQGKLYLRYDIWEQWLPVLSSWNLERYVLNLTPRYRLLEEERQSRRKLWERQVKERNGQEQIAQLEPLPLQDALRYEGRYNLSIGQNQNSTSSSQSSTLGYDVVADLYGGTILLSGSSQSTKVQNEGEVATNASHNHLNWNYKLLHTPWFDRLEAGTMLAPGGVLIPNLSVKNGLRVKRLPDQLRSSDALMIQGQTLPGTEIALYRGGFLITYVTVAPDGMYSFPEVSAFSGEQVRLKYYFPDGSVRDEVLQIPADNGSIIPAEEWDAEFFSGESKHGSISRAFFAWGINPDLTTGVQLYSLPQELPSQSMAILSASYRPIWGLLLQTELGSHNQGTDLGINTAITLFDPHYVALTLKQQSLTSPIRFLQSGDEQSQNLLKLQHSYYYSNWQWQAEIAQLDFSDKSKFTIRRHLTPHLSAFWESQNTSYSNGESLLSNAVVMDYILGNHTLQGKIDFTNHGTGLETSYRFQGIGDKPYDILVSLGQSPTGEKILNATFRWRPYPGARVEATVGSANSSALVGYSGIYAAPPGPTSYEEFGRGTLVGDIHYPAEANSEPNPMPGAVIQCGNQKGVSDEQGKFMVTGLPVDQLVVCQIDPGTLDVGLTPAVEAQSFWFRAATLAEYHPQLIRTLGADGQIKTKRGLIPAEAMMKFTKLPKGYEVQVPIEPDGFFVVENLPPGEYQMELVNVQNPPPPKTVNFESGSVWHSNLLIEWR